MSVTWKINGVAVGPSTNPAYSKLALLFQNQAADEFTFDRNGQEFDSSPDFAIDSAVKLTRTDSAATPILATALVAGLSYQILTLGSTTFTTVGAASNTVGLEFVATGVGTGTGTVLPAVICFRGHIRGTPRTARPRESAIGYRALGPWQWLERIDYLQTIKLAVDPSSTSIVLASALSGRAILGQKGDGTQQTVGQFLNDVFDFAIAQLMAGGYGTVFARDDFSTQLTATVPWDQVKDHNCADVMSRYLQVFPDAVLWVDYSVAVPKFYIKRVAALTNYNLPLTPPNDGTPFASAVRGELQLRERPELKKSGVVLVYLSLNHANDASWLVETVDAYPGGCATTALNGSLQSIADPPNTLVRTIELAGFDQQITTLTQPVTVAALPSTLIFSGAITTGSNFTTLSDWWKKHCPELLKANVTIKAFLDGTRTLTDGSAITLVTGNPKASNELIKGTVTDWMETNIGIFSESQVVEVGIDYEIADPLDSTKKERIVKQLHANIIATTAQTQTYNFNTATSYTPPEAVPSGLAQAIYNAISAAQFSGSWLFTEAEPSGASILGSKISILSDVLPKTATVQREEIEIDNGQSRVFFGTPAHLGPDDLVELYRVNRVRRPVTIYDSRTSGVAGSLVSRQSLTVHHPKTTVAASERTHPRHFTKAMTVAAVVPTSTEVATALASGWATNDHPVAGDVVNLTVGGAVKLAYLLTLSAQTPDGIKIVSFTVSSVTYYGFMVQRGIY